MSEKKRGSLGDTGLSDDFYKFSCPLHGHFLFLRSAVGKNYVPECPVTHSKENKKAIYYLRLERGYKFNQG